MNRKGFFDIIAVRIGMAAVVLLGSIFVITGAFLHTDRDIEQYEKSGQADESTQPEAEEIGIEAEAVTETVIKTADMYMEEVQVYIKYQDYLAAIEVLMEGIEETGDAALAEKENDLREHIIIKKETRYEIDKLRWEKEYDKAGNIIKEVYYDRDSGSIMQWHEYEYDSEGKVIKHVDRDSTGDIISQCEYEYDKTGNRVKEYYYADGSIGSMNECEYEYEYAYID